MSHKKAPNCAPTLQLSLQFGVFADAAQHRAILSRRRVVRWVTHALQYPGEITVRVVGSDEAQTLNHSYRQRNYATNVLTFAYAQAPVVSADLVLCAPVVAQEAQAQGKTLAAHYAHLLVHATLHAQGYEHETCAQDALEMEAAEILLLGALGYGNPY